jgi:DNA helicase-2/ATP-dependent DNA helicase PcrA
MHTAKGREWKCVFLVGIVDGLMPIYLARSQKKASEERRLLYVAATRASVSLRMFQSPVRHAISRKRFHQPSPFLEDAIDRDLLDVIHYRALRHR